jgi:hypothetical protein
MTSKVLIDIDGRPALPLRALPYVTAWGESPDSLVRALGLAPTSRPGAGIERVTGHRFDIPNKYALTAYRMNADGTWAVIPHRQWLGLAVELSCLTTKLLASERHGADGENHGRWRIDATLALPDDVFVWLDEFEHWFAPTRPLAIPTDTDLALWRAEQAQLYDGDDLAMVLEEGMADFAQPGQLDFTVVLPTELVGRIWRYSAVAQGPLCGTNTTVKPRGGRPPTVHKKASVVAALMAEFEKAGAAWSDPLQLPGNVADLLEAIQRTEKSVTGKTRMFQVSSHTFQGWLSGAGFGFGPGRARADQARYWTRLAPQIVGKITPDVFGPISLPT